jgi:ankyrin repeat protein
MLNLFGDIMQWSEWKNYDNQRPIDVAAEYGHRDILEKYLVHHPSPKGINKIVRAAVRHHNDEVSLYLRRKNLANKSDYSNVLHYACRQFHGHQSINHIIVSSEMSTYDTNGFTPLMLTIKHRRLESARKLLENDSCTKEVLEMISNDGSERTVLHICAEVNRDDITDVLLEKFNRLFKNDNKPWIMCDVMGNTLLHICAQKGNRCMCEKMILYYKHNSSNSKNQSSKELPLWAMKNYNKWTAFHEAIKNGHSTIVDTMHQHMDATTFWEMAAIVDEELRTSLHMAAEKGQLIFEFLF